MIKGKKKKGWVAMSGTRVAMADKKEESSMTWQMWLDDGKCWKKASVWYKHKEACHKLIVRPLLDQSLSVKRAPYCSSSIVFWYSIGRFVRYEHILVKVSSLIDDKGQVSMHMAGRVPMSASWPPKLACLFSLPEIEHLWYSSTWAAGVRDHLASLRVAYFLLLVA